MQNTLEQLVMLALPMLVLAVELPAGGLQMLPILAVGFAVARAVYWRGYLRPGNVLGRSPGVQLTFTLTLGGTIMAFALLVTRWVGAGSWFPVP